MFNDDGGVGTDSSSVRRGRSRRAFLPGAAARRAGAFFRRGLLRAAVFRDAARARAFGREERLGLAAFRALFATLLAPLAFRLAIVQLLSQP